MVPARITPDWLRERLESAQVSQREAARIVEADERTMRRWCLGERDMPRAAAVLLDARLFLRAGDKRSALATIAEPEI